MAIRTRSNERSIETNPTRSKSKAQCNSLRVRVVLARHGESFWNAAGILQGHDGPGLNERGLSQAKMLARQIATRFPDTSLIISSDLDRVKETAKETAALIPQARLTFDSRFRESDIGSWSGKTLFEVSKEDPKRLRAWLLGDDVRRGGGETRIEMLMRVTTALRQAVAKMRKLTRLQRTAGTIVVFTHGGPIRMLAASLLGLFPDGYTPLEPPFHGSITILQVNSVEHSRVYGRLECYNQTSHITGLLRSSSLDVIETAT